MALGCNIGVRHMAQITRSVAEKGLDEVVKWYFSQENLRQANDVIVNYIKQLKLRIHLKDDPDLTYTSSDGQKVEVAQDSLLARSSFKYFGNRKGVSAYNYPDDTLLLFDSLVFSAGDREATAPAARLSAKRPGSYASGRLRCAFNGFARSNRTNL